MNLNEIPQKLRELTIKSTGERYELKNAFRLDDKNMVILHFHRTGTPDTFWDKVEGGSKE